MTASRASTLTEADPRGLVRPSVKRAVEHGRLLSRRGLQDRLFTLSFSGLVYAQIWEDPAIDMEALALGPGDRLVAIASGGCNVLSYLLADPAAITAVDLNRHHVALTRLKVAAARGLDDPASFFALFGRGRGAGNAALYRRLRPSLDEATRRYWDGRDAWGARRSGYLAKGLHRHGLLGRFIAAGHLVARLHGRDLGAVLRASDREGQRRAFAREVAPLFDSPLVRWLCRRRASLYGLGIPPAQYDALARDGEGASGIAGVLRERLRRLACDFDVGQNYFAWAAFARGYGPEGQAPVPPYLARDAFALLRERAGRIEVRHANLLDHLRAVPDASLDAYSLLDAQDWMTEAMRTTLWREITRTARPGARVIFRTAGRDGSVPAAVAHRWSTDRDRCLSLTARDRSAIYGGFHLYTLRGPA